MTTLKVELLEEGVVSGFTEDVYTEWIPCEARIIQGDCQGNKELIPLLS